MSNDRVALTEARQLIKWLTAIVKTFVSPDGKHRALRSPYSHRGVCTIYPQSEHSNQCLEMFAVLQIADDWWRAHPEVEAPRQPDLFDMPDQRQEAVR